MDLYRLKDRCQDDCTERSATACINGFSVNAAPCSSTMAMVRKS
jgi:hypothetical protein